MSSIAAPDRAPIVEQIERADAQRRRRFRLVFAATWATLIGGLLASLAIGGAIELTFLQEGPPWWRFILGKLEILTEGQSNLVIGPLRFLITGAFATILLGLDTFRVTFFMHGA